MCTPVSEIRSIPSSLPEAILLPSGDMLTAKTLPRQSFSHPQRLLLRMLTMSVRSSLGGGSHPATPPPLSAVLLSMWTDSIVRLLPPRT